jgi:hypothetical protein
MKFSTFFISFSFSLIALHTSYDPAQSNILKFYLACLTSFVVPLAGFALAAGRDSSINEQVTPETSEKKTFQISPSNWI